MESEYLTAIVNLLIVLGLIVVCLYVIKRFRFNQFQRNKLVNIVQTIPIGTKERLILVEVNNSYFLLGATTNRIETLHIFEEEELVQLNIEKEMLKEANH